MQTRRSLAALTAVALLGIAGAGCGARSSTQTVDHTRTATRTVTTTAPATTSPATPVSSSVPRCHTGQLSFTFGTNGAAGSILILGSLTNHSTATCSLYGYPGVGLLGRQGQSLPASALRSRGPAMPDVAERLVTLAPGGKANFFASFGDVDPQPCPVAKDLEVTPPNAYGHVTVAFGFTPCRGEIHVSPVFTPGAY